jgi:hypothetical protein
MTTLRKSAEKLKVNVEDCLVDVVFYILSIELVVAAGKGNSERGVVNHKRSTYSFAMFVCPSLKGIWGIRISSALHKLPFQGMLRLTTRWEANLWDVLRLHSLSARCHMFPIYQGTK